MSSKGEIGHFGGRMDTPVKHIEENMAPRNNASDRKTGPIPRNPKKKSPENNLGRFSSSRVKYKRVIIFKKQMN